MNLLKKIQEQIDEGYEITFHPMVPFPTDKWEGGMVVRVIEMDEAGKTKAQARKAIHPEIPPDVDGPQYVGQLIDHLVEKIENLDVEETE